jgi:hypothetical protein
MKSLQLVGYSFLVTATLVVSRLAGTGDRPEGSVFYGQLFGISPLALLLLTALGVAFTLGLFCAFTGSKKYEFFLGLLALSAGLYILLPTLKGYFSFSRGDPSDTIGYVTTIINAGQIVALDPYPAIHVLGAAYSEITDASKLGLFPIFVEVFYIVFLLGSFSLIRRLLKSERGRRISYLMVPSASFAFIYVAQDMALSLLPLILFLRAKGGNRATLAYACMLTALAITHPLVMGFFVFSIAIWEIFTKHSLTTMSLFGIIVFATWTSYNLYLSIETARMITEFAIGVAPNAEVVTQAVSTLGPLNALSTFARQVGLFPLLAIIEIYVIVKRRILGTSLGILLIFMATSFLLFPVSFLIQSFGLQSYSRFIPYVRIGSILAVPAIGYISPSTLSRRTLLSLLLLGVLLSSAFSAYPSWYSYYPNDQVTQNEFIADSWLFGHIVDGLGVGGPLYEATKLYNQAEGTTLSLGYRYQYYPFSRLQMGTHFSTLTPSNLAGYLVVLMYAARIDYNTIYANTNTFNETDFRNYISAPGHNLVYSSPDEQIIFISQG